MPAVRSFGIESVQLWKPRRILDEAKRAQRLPNLRVVALEPLLAKVRVPHPLQRLGLGLGLGLRLGLGLGLGLGLANVRVRVRVT